MSKATVGGYLEGLLAQLGSMNDDRWSVYVEWYEKSGIEDRQNLVNLLGGRLEALVEAMRGSDDLCELVARMAMTTYGEVVRRSVSKRLGERMTNSTSTTEDKHED